MITDHTKPGAALEIVCEPGITVRGTFVGYDRGSDRVIGDWHIGAGAVVRQSFRRANVRVVAS